MLTHSRVCLLVNQPELEESDEPEESEVEDTPTQPTMTQDDLIKVCALICAHAPAPWFIANCSLTVTSQPSVHICSQSTHARTYQARRLSIERKEELEKLYRASNEPSEEENEEVSEVRFFAVCVE